MAWDDLLDEYCKGLFVELLLEPGSLRDIALKAFPLSFPASLDAQASHRSKSHRKQLYLQYNIIFIRFSIICFSPVLAIILDILPTLSTTQEVRSPSFRPQS